MSRVQRRGQCPWSNLCPLNRPGNPKASANPGPVHYDLLINEVTNDMNAVGGRSMHQSTGRTQAPKSSGIRTATTRPLTVTTSLTLMVDAMMTLRSPISCTRPRISRSGPSGVGLR